MTREKDGTTTITASIADQAQLHGVLAGLRDIGAVITELRTTDPPIPLRPSALERPLHTERLTLRPATAHDADPTWKYRQLEPVNQWYGTTGPEARKIGEQVRARRAARTPYARMRGRSRSAHRGLPAAWIRSASGL
jgi:hypothetical protein